MKMVSQADSLTFYLFLMLIASIFILGLPFEIEVRYSNNTNPCVPAKGKSISIIENITNLKFPTIPIQIFSLPGFKGRKLDITVNGCTHLDRGLERVEIPASIRIPRARCVLLFYIPDSGETGDERDCIVPENGSYNILEFQDTNPDLEDTVDRFSSSKYIMALSPCACLSRMSYSGKDFPQDENIIVLYSAPNFEGESLEISLNFVGCKTLKDEEITREWEGFAQSMFVANKSCVVVFMEHYCPPNAQMSLNVSVPQLSDYDLENRIRSLRVCDEEQFNIQGEDSLVMYYLIPLSSLSTLVAVGLIVVQIYMRKRFHNVYKDIKEKLSDKEVKQFMEGLGLELSNDAGDYHHETVCESGIGPVKSKLSADLLSQNQPYDTSFEIPFAQLKYDSSCPIGSGEFGVVFQGILNRTGKDAIPVAIKTTKPHTSSQYLRVLLKEIKVMMFVGTHKHVVSLVGCCTAKLRDGILFIVLEYCVNGSLERHMKLNRPNFQNLVQRGKILGNKKPVVLEPEDENPNYMKAIPNSNVCMEKRQFNNHQLINWSIEVAKGMEFLSSKRVIHGDLSARNVLLTEHIEAKISDFGLSRKMYSYTHYTKDGEEPLPWRWLALECLKNLQFSTASDVWSFGILLFEICTLGEQPYPGVSSLTNNFIINLEEGLRPAFPLFATSDIYNIMSSCWDENPSRRPTFSRLVLTIEEARAACNKFVSKTT